jgi:hypothetical protein
MAKHDPPKKGTPKTGDGRTSGRKPKTEDLKQLKSDGMVHRSQPEGWMGKVIKLFRD